ncbi:hypothetical protein, partial [Bradyrhizobium sp. 190]|uniref:hypothetical protein n=1 Tax=Bradyrhizobium sp. 190 TaxID=2782658 RepID=UPI001FF8319C
VPDTESQQFVTMEDQINIASHSVAATMCASASAFAETTHSGVNIKLGQWPTWQIIPKENRSFTKD